MFGVGLLENCSKIDQSCGLVFTIVQPDHIQPDFPGPLKIHGSLILRYLTWIKLVFWPIDYNIDTKIMIIETFMWRKYEHFESSFESWHYWLVFA